MGPENKARITRRDFVKGGALVGAAVAASGAKVAAASPARAPVTTDVVVVGMGFAGLVAGLRALELGAKVTIIDKIASGDWVGGSFLLSGQSIHVCSNSPMLPEAYLRKLIAGNTAGRPQTPYQAHVDAYVTNVKAGMKWLMDKGVEFVEPAGQERTIKPPKPAGVGRFAWALLKPGAPNDYRQFGAFKTAKMLESSIKEKGGNLLYETKALRLLTDDKNEVSGVLVNGKDGNYEINAGAVILCTGGMNRNREMAERYMGRQASDIIVQCAPGTTGDGHQMALDLGAGLKNPGYTYVWPCPAVAAEDPWHDLLGFIDIDTVGTEGIIVNKLGQRFCNEALGRHVYGNTLFRQGSVQGLMVIDQAIYNKPTNTPILEGLVKMGGEVIKADSIGELVTKAGVGPALLNTVKEFNQAVDDGQTEHLLFPKTAKVNKLNNPPFYGIPFVVGTLFHYGGVTVTPKAEVTNRDNQPIPGLFAAGELITGNLSGGAVNQAGAYTGDLAGTCLTFGMIAAQSAVDLVNSSKA